MARLASRTAALCLMLGYLSVVAYGQTGQIAIRSMNVRAEITGPVAVNTLEFVFTNYTDRPGDVSIVLQLPEEAAVQDLALWVDGLRSPGELLPRIKAEAIYREITSARRDPALLTFLGRGKWSLQVSPIPARGTQKVQVVYTTLLRPRDGMMVYRGPTLAKDLRPTVQELDFAATVRGDIKDIKAVKQDLGVQRVAGGFNVGLRKESPNLDEPLEFGIADKSAGSTIWMGDTFATFLPMPKFLTQQTPQARNFVLVIDTSLSMQEDWIRVRLAVSRIMERMKSGDRFAIVAVASDVKLWKDSLADVNKDNLDEAAEFVKSLKVGGGTDLAAALRAVEDLNKNKDTWLEVIMISDGVDRVGIDSETRDVEEALNPPAGKTASTKPSTSPTSQPQSQPSFLDVRPPRNCRFYGVLLSNRSCLHRMIAGFGGLEYGADSIKEMVEQSRVPSIQTVEVRSPNGGKAKFGTALGEDSIAVVGRWPAGLDKPVEVLVTGVIDLKEVTEKYQIQPPANLPAGQDRDRPNPMLPVWASLWAQKMHHDLVQQDEPTLKDMEELLNFAKTWHIATPATALLVLETMDDYVRRGLKREVSVLKVDEGFMAKTQELAKALAEIELTPQNKQELQQLRFQVADLIRLGQYVAAAEACDRMVAIDKSQVEEQARADMLRELEALRQVAQARKSKQEAQEEALAQALPWHHVLLATEYRQWVPMMTASPRKTAAATVMAGSPADAQAAKKLEVRLPKVEFANLEFQSVVEYLQKSTNAKFHVNWSALLAATVDKTTQITLSLTDVTAQKVLETVLLDLSTNARVTYVLDDGIVRISTKDELAKSPVIRVYDIRDLIQHTTPPRAPLRTYDPSVGSDSGPFDESFSNSGSSWGKSESISSSIRLQGSADPDISDTSTTRIYDIRDLVVRVPNFAGPRIDMSRFDSNNSSGEERFMTRLEGAKSIMDTLTQSIDRDSWVPMGTIGTIREIGGILVITQTLENHARLTALINTLKEALLDAPLPEAIDGPQPTESLFTQAAMITKWTKDLLTRAADGKLSKYSSVQVKKVGSITLARIGGYWIDTRLTTADHILLLSPSSEALVEVLRANDGLQEVLAMGPAIVAVGAKYAISLDQAGYRRSDEPEVQKLLMAMKKS